MKTITTSYLQSKIGEVIERLIRGEEMILTRRDKEIGKIVPIVKEKKDR